MIAERLLTFILFATFIICNATTDVKFPIVYVYSLSNKTCAGGFPGYIKEVLAQAVLFQEDCEIIMASNYADCTNGGSSSPPDIANVTKIDTTLIASSKTREYLNSAAEMFAHGDLWLLSSTRFFHLEDYMIKHNRTELLHVEADNLLYGKVNQISQNVS